MNRSKQTTSELLKTLEAFNHLSAHQLRGIETISLVKHYAENEIVFYEGDDSGYFHFLIEGEITVLKSSAMNDTIAIHRFLAPSMIAEMATLKAIPYPASAQCVRECVVLKIARNPFLELLKSDPSLGITMISSLMSKISALEIALQRHSAPNAISKVARLIRDDIAVFARLKGVDIAQLLGITPETLSRMLKKFKDESVISPLSPRGYTLIDPVKLDSFADNNFPLRG